MDMWDIIKLNQNAFQDARKEPKLVKWYGVLLSVWTSISLLTKLCLKSFTGILLLTGMMIWVISEAFIATIIQIFVSPFKN